MCRLNGVEKKKKATSASLFVLRLGMCCAHSINQQRAPAADCVMFGAKCYAQRNGSHVHATT